MEETTKPNALFKKDLQMVTAILTGLLAQLMETLLSNASKTVIISMEELKQDRLHSQQRGTPMEIATYNGLSSHSLHQDNESISRVSLVTAISMADRIQVLRSSLVL